MQKQATKIKFNPLLFIIPFFCCMVFNSSCSKDNNIAEGVKDDTTKINTPAGSTIIYTDVQPGSKILDTSGKLYNLDLNNDGTTDFIFTEIARAITGCRGKTGTIYIADVRPASGNNNAIMYNGAVPSSLDSLTVIDVNGYWTNDTINKELYANTTGAAAQCYPPTGPWNYTSYKYIGLRFIKNGNTYYAWARIYKGTDLASLILTGYAYNSKPNELILAGQTK